MIMIFYTIIGLIQESVQTRLPIILAKQAGYLLLRYRSFLVLLLSFGRWRFSFPRPRNGTALISRVRRLLGRPSTTSLAFRLVILPGRLAFTSYSGSNSMWLLRIGS